MNTQGPNCDTRARGLHSLHFIVRRAIEFSHIHYIRDPFGFYFTPIVRQSVPMFEGDPLGRVPSDIAFRFTKT